MSRLVKLLVTSEAMDYKPDIALAEVVQTHVIPITLNRAACS